MFKEKKTACLLLITLIIMLGAFLRFHGIANQSLEMDELSSWDTSSRTFHEMITFIRNDVHPPGYQIILYFTERYLGSSEALLRLPSAIAGILSIYLIFLIGRALYSWKEGLVAAALMAVLKTPIYYSQQARSYSLLLFFTLLSTYYWIILLRTLDTRDRPSLFTSAAYAVSAVLSSYMHYFGLLMVALQGIGLCAHVIRNKKALLFTVYLYLGIAAAYLPWAANTLMHLTDRQCWIPRPNFQSFALFFSFLFNDSNGVIRDASRGLTASVLALYLISMLRSAYDLLTKGEEEAHVLTLTHPAFLLLSWFLVPFAVTWLISTVSVPVLSSRNLIISLPAAYLLLARSIVRFPVHRKMKAVIAPLFILFLLYHLVVFRHYYTAVTKQQVREMVEFVARHDTVNRDAVIIKDPPGPFLNYYFTRYGVTAVQEIDWRRELLSFNKQKIKQTAPPYIWYLYTGEFPDKLMLDYLHRNYTLVDKKELKEATAWLFAANRGKQRI